MTGSGLFSNYWCFNTQCEGFDLNMRDQSSALFSLCLLHCNNREVFIMPLFLSQYLPAENNRGMKSHWSCKACCCKMPPLSRYRQANRQAGITTLSLHFGPTIFLSTSLDEPCSGTHTERQLWLLRLETIWMLYDQMVSYNNDNWIESRDGTELIITIHLSVVPRLSSFIG